MNHSSPYLNSHIASAAEPRTDFTLSPTKSVPPSCIAPPDEQEDDDSTIKCICGFKHDDGNSVFCERCNTWQHTECYYYIEQEDRLPPKDELEAILHLCTDCEPRPLNIQAAVRRQKPRSLETDHDERKAKKSGSKSHKKKTKIPDANGVLTNGWSHDFDGLHDRTSRSPRDHLPQPKRPKTNHRSSNPMSIPAVSQNFTSHPYRRPGSTLNSPFKVTGKHTSNGFIKGPYSADFMHLYDNDPGDQPMQTNLLSDINITGDLSLWTYDAEALREATRGFSHANVFHRMDRPLSDMMGPPPRKEYMEDESVVVDGRHPTWICLISDVFIEEKTIVGELKGKIGHMKDYIQEPTNRWDYLRHPAPFVFFHPRLPIYIDTRSEGTICRYLRRSCRPNLIMTTFLENESEYHFCFTAKQGIPAGAELTIGWVLDEHMRKFNSIKNDMTQDVGAGGEEYITDWVSKVFPEFGGCACGAPDDCWLSSRIKASVKGRGGHTKERQPTTSHAMNAKDDSDRDDERSTSRSKSGSRDITPTGPSTGEYGLGPGMEISDREKRKIAALEKNFEQLENDKHQPAVKKKKRNSGGLSANTPGPGTSVCVTSNPLTRVGADRMEQKQLGHTASSISQPNTPGLPSKSQYTDAGVPRRKSGSPTAKSLNAVGRRRSTNPSSCKKKSSQPNTPTDASSIVRLNYVSVAVQTVSDEENDWYKPPLQPVGLRKPYMSLTKRLLLRSQHDRQKLEELRRPAQASSSQIAVGSQGISNAGDPQAPLAHEDVDKADAGTATFLEAQCSAENMPAPDHNPSKPVRRSSTDIKPPPWPSLSVQPCTELSAAINGLRSVDLHLQLPAKLPQFSTSSSGTSTTKTPSSAMPQSPNAHAISYPPLLPSSACLVQPSPVKKKVSLSDYIKRKGSHSTESKAMISSPEISHSALRIPLAISNGEKLVEGSAIIDTPKKEASNPLDSTVEGAGAIPTAREERRTNS
ncbi:MAG: hypothetical protein Q9217_005396 [Psora testacea]